MRAYDRLREEDAQRKDQVHVHQVSPDHLVIAVLN
jgi:hypothetical protein